MAGGVCVDVCPGRLALFVLEAMLTLTLTTEAGYLSGLVGCDGRRRTWPLFLRMRSVETFA